MNKKPNVCILRSDGTNCDFELFYAFEKYGGKPEFVHVNQLRSREKKLDDFQILAFPGGFSYGDDVASGKILAVEMTSYFSDDLKKFVDRKNTLTIGICNGFQTLIRTGLLPFGNIGKMDATLTNNDSGHFECRWVNVKGEKSRCVFLDNENIEQSISVSVNHGEGKFYASNETILAIEQSGLVVFRYIDNSGKPTQHYPENPNDSTNAIAGICDPSGRIFGLMPHPEKNIDKTQHPNWRREVQKDWGFLFKNMIAFARKA